MLKTLRNDHGSASVLVMLIMISLITFGLLAMLLSNSDYKMAKKNAKWLNQQYAIESRAAQAEAALDNALATLPEAQGYLPNEQMLLKYAGQKVEALTTKEFQWKWVPEDQTAICEVLANSDGQAMTLGFKIWVVPNKGHYQLVYDIVSWRATRQ